MKTALACLLAALPLAAAASYPVEVDARMNGLAVEVMASAGTPLVITFASKEKRDVRCTAAIDSGFDTPQDRTVTVKAGKSAVVNLTLRAPANRVRVRATCEPAKPRS